MALAMQHQGRHQATDPGSDNGDSECFPPPLMPLIL